MEKEVFDEILIYRGSRFSSENFFEKILGCLDDQLKEVGKFKGVIEIVRNKDLEKLSDKK